MGTTIRHYDTTICYLEKNYDHSFFSEEFSEIHINSVITHLESTNKDFILEENTKNISNAIEDFFKSYHQEVSAIYYKDKFIIKCNYKLKDVLTEVTKQELNKLRIYIIELFEEIDNYYYRNDLVIFDNEKFNKILSIFPNAKIETIKKIIKYQFFKIFALQKNDKVFFIRNQIAIRVNSRKNNIAVSEKRYSGIPIKELEKLEACYIDEKFQDNLLVELEKKFKTELNFSKITNKKFCSIYIKEFQNITSEALSEAKKNMDYALFEGFINYVLRSNFDFLLAQTAKHILLLVKGRAPNIENYIRFYNGETIINSGFEKHMKPSIIDQDGEKWTYGNIHSLCLGCEKQELLISRLKKRRKEIVNKISNIQKLILTQNNELKIIENRLTDLSSQIKGANSLTLKYKNKDKKTYNKYYRKEELLVSKNYKLKKELQSFNLNLANKTSNINSWQIILKELTNKIEDETLQFSKMTEKSTLIVVALAKVLNKKKIIIKEKGVSQD